MAKKLALGLKGYFIPQFFDRAYIERESEVGTNPWLIERNIDILPLKGHYSVYKSVVKVVAQKEEELARMKVVLPTIKDMNERQRRREFTHEKKDFPDNHPTKRLTIKPREGEGNFDQEMKILSGKECAEQFCMWLKDFEEELILTDRMPWTKVESALHALTTGEAREEVNIAYRAMRKVAKGQFGQQLWNKEVVKNLWLRKALYAKYTDDSKLRLAMSTAEEHKAEAEAFIKFCYKEAIYRLQVHFFGDDLFGRNVYRQLKRVIARLQPNPVKGIDKYKRRVTELQALLPYTLWEQGMHNGAERPPVIEENELRDYLCDNINQAQRAYLKQQNHDIYNKSYIETIMFLKRGEDDINIKQAAIKQQEAKEKEDFKKSKQNGGNKRKNANGGDKTKCKHCANFHLGECRLKDTADDILKGGKGNPPKNKTGSTNPKKNKGKKPKLADQVQKLTETIQSMNNQSNRPSWGKGMNSEEFKAIQLSLAVDKGMTPDQVLAMNFDGEDINRYKAAYEKCSN